MALVLQLKLLLASITICSLSYIIFTGENSCVQIDFLPNYNGTINTTLNGMTCQRWDAQSPHKHQYTDPGLFPETTLEDAANYCRTPDGSDLPWCFTTSPEVRSQVCDLDSKLCGGGITSGA